MFTNETINLFAIPYAGGSSLIYHKWRNELSKNVILKPLELAGRGNRFKEKNYETFDEAINDMLKKILNQIDCNNKFIVFGHSMGGLIAYHVCLKLIREYNKTPELLIISACKPPHIFNENRSICVNDETILNELIISGRISEEILNEKEFKEIIFPSIKNDFRLAREYKNENLGKVDCCLVCMYGRNDEIPESKISEWGKYSDRIQFIPYYGDHFFISNEYPKICEFINESVNKCF